jgi:heterodisulfide reductase subunit B
MKEYIATFHTHLSAMMTCRTLTGFGIQARMMPVPRKLSSSCGTCVRYLADAPHLDAMDEDVEAVYEKISKEDYTLLMNAE